MIYLDHNATTLIHPEVQILLKELMSIPLNASSTHYYGRKARSIIEEARASILNLVGTDNNTHNVVFTSSGTEANNLLINNFKDNEIFVSAIEHLSLLEWNKYLNNINIIKVTRDGIIDLVDLENKLINSNGSIKLISVMLANNETGVIQPLKEIITIAKKYNAKIHSDLVQCVGKMEINFKELELDFATISSHKFGGPIGAGALIIPANYFLKAVMIGGGQEKGIRSGTENILSIAGLGLASTLAIKELNFRINKMRILQNKLELNLPLQWKVVAKNSNRLPNTSMIIANNIKADSLIISLDLRGFLISNGSACSSGKVKKSYVLNEMNYNNEEIDTAVRVSFSHHNTEEEINLLISALHEISNKRKIA